MSLLAMLALLAAPPPPPDAGADLSEEEFVKAFGKSRARPGEKEKKAAAYVPPAPGSGGTGAIEKLEPKHVLEVVVAAKADIKRCADGQRNLQHGKSTLTLQWTIGLDGRVTRVETVGEELKGSYVAGCVTKLVRRWQFPKHTVLGEPVVFPFKL
jgi:hypothetical protein